MSNQLFLSLISGIFISGTCAYLGTLMLSKKMSVIAGPLAHLALPGVALAIIFSFSFFIGVFPFVILGAILIWFLEKQTKLPMENLAAIVFAVGVGSALLILPIEQAEAALIGNIGIISFAETVVTVIVALSIIFLINNIYAKVMLANIHEDLAQISGIKIGLYNFLYLISIALSVAIAVYLVGGLITAALIAIPSATGKNISNNLTSYKLWAVFFGVISTIIGIIIGYSYDLPIGPIVIITGSVFFLVTVFLKNDH